LFRILVQDTHGQSDEMRPKGKEHVK
jgi:hypothetical protein